MWSSSWSAWREARLWRSRQCLHSRAVPTEVITEVEMKPLDREELAARPGIVGHIVQEKEDLWSLAKKYMTTAEGIREVNGLENDAVKPGDKLLIFKENMSIM